MARVPKQPNLPLAKPAAPTGPQPCPDLLAEYTPMTSTERWRVEKFSMLAAEFQLIPTESWEKQMALFHEMAATDPRRWLFVQRLYGITPLIIPEGASPEAYRTLTRGELCAENGLSSDKHLQAELDAIRAMWGMITRRETEASTVETKAMVPARPMTEAKRESEVLKEFGFSDKMFVGVKIYDPTADQAVNPSRLVDREPGKNAEERAWFVARCEDWRTMYKEPRARTLVREALLNELYLMRLQDEMSLMTPSMSDFDRLDKRKASFEERYQNQLEKLESMFPDMNVAGRVSLRHVVSTLIGAHQDFYGDKNNVRRDALFTQAEIDVLMRQSTQSPVPQYRMSLSLLIVEAVHGLYDRDFRSKLAEKPTLLKKIDAAVRAAVDAARAGANEPLVDLEDGVLPGEGSQHPDLLEI